jgi:hypothetical protein
MRLWLAAIAAVVAAGATGCGFGEDELTQRVQQPGLLSQKDLEGHPAGSPGRTMFEWWRTLQFDNPVVAAGFYSKKLDLSPAKLERQLEFGAGPLGLARRPKLVEVQEQGNKAVVLVLLEQKTDNPNGRVDTVRTARSFNLVREEGEWKLAENLYLERGARLQSRLREFLFRSGRRPNDQPNGRGDSGP